MNEAIRRIDEESTKKIRKIDDEIVQIRLHKKVAKEAIKKAIERSKRTEKNKLALAIR